MSAVFIEAVGIAAPGLANWSAAAAILRDEVPYVAEPLAPHTPALLPANERRRATATIRLAFQAAEDAMSNASIPAQALATVFASSDADLNIIHRICLALTTEQRLVSPTDFHNSVHNAAAGYWGIAVGAHTASNTVCGYDDSFTVGLAEAMGLVAVEGANVLLVAFDLPPPEPLYGTRPIECPAAAALVLTCERTARSVATLRCTTSTAAASAMAVPALEQLRLATPAARVLPLLQVLAQRTANRIVLAAAGGQGIAVDVQPL